MIKDFDTGWLSWIIWLDPKWSHIIHKDVVVGELKMQE